MSIYSMQIWVDKDLMNSGVERYSNEYDWCNEKISIDRGRDGKWYVEIGERYMIYSGTINECLSKVKELIEN